MVKVVINSCYGEFSVSQTVYRYLIDKKGWQISSKICDPNQKFIFYSERDKDYCCIFIQKDRANPDLIDAIETIGLDNSVDANRFAKLQIFDIPDNIKWYISEYDGWEEIHEEHRIWR